MTFGTQFVIVPNASKLLQTSTEEGKIYKNKSDAIDVIIWIVMTI